MSSGQLTEDERRQQVLINKENAVSIWLPVNSYQYQLVPSQPTSKSTGSVPRANS